MSKLGLSYITDLQNKPGLPVNLPYFWKFILSVPTKESGFVDGGNKLMNDLFHDITNYYLDKDIRTCAMYQKQLYRIVKFRYYDDFSSLSTTIQSELKNNYFIYPESVTISGSSTGLIDYKYQFVDDIPLTIANLTNSFYNPTVNIKQDVNYRIEDSTMTFMFNPIESEDSFEWTTTSYVTSGGTTLTIRECNLIAINIKLEESPLYNNYGALVYNSEYDPDSETEQEYRQKIVGLFLLYYNGMKINVLNAAVNTMLGLPVFLYDNERIKKITSTEITTDKTTYTIDPLLPLREEVVVGAIFNQFDCLHKVVQITDHMTDPDWINGRSVPDWMFITPAQTQMNPSIDYNTTQDLKIATGPFNMNISVVIAGLTINSFALSGLTYNNSDEGKLYYTFEYDHTGNKEAELNLYSDSSGGLDNLVAYGKIKVTPSEPGTIPITATNDSGIFGEINVTGPTSDVSEAINVTDYFTPDTSYDDNVDIRFDLFDIKPEYSNTSMYPQAKTNNYYIWEKYFKNILFNIHLAVNYMSFDELDNLGVIDEVLPLNVYYLRTIDTEFSEDYDFEDVTEDSATSSSTFEFLVNHNGDPLVSHNGDNLVTHNVV